MQDVSTFFEIIGFFVDHSVWVAAGSVMAIGAAMLAPALLSRSTSRKLALRTASATNQPHLSGSTVPGQVADPMDLLHAYARKRRSHLLMLDTPSEAESKSEKAEGSELILLEAFLFNYRDIPKDQPIDVVLGRSLRASVSAVRRIARILDAHPAKVTAIVPFQVVGPIGLLALAADEIVMSEDAAIVPDDDITAARLAALARKKRSQMSAQSVVSLLYLEHKVRETEWLAGLLLKSRRVRRWKRVARSISRGTYNVISPLRPEDLRSWGLKVTTDGFIETLATSDVAVKVLASRQEVSGPAIKVAPTCTATCPVGDTRDAMIALEQQRGSRVIAMIHGRGMSEPWLDKGTTAEALKAIRAVPAGIDIDIILHTPGGSALGASQIVRALKAHKGRKTFFVPYDAYSAGTILALTGNEIFMSEIATLGPIDVQFGEIGSAAALGSVLRHKWIKDIDDDLLVLAMHAQRTIRQCHENALAAMKGTYSRFRAERIARTLNSGYLSHGFPLMYQEARMVGLNVRPGVPKEVFAIVEGFLTQPGGYCSVIHCPD